MTEQEKIWVAGFFDGEGCVTIRKPYKTKKGTAGYTLAVTVSQKNKPILDWLKEEWGGCVVQQMKGSGVWAWRITSLSAGIFLLDIVDYLRLKKAQAQLGIELQKSKRNIPRVDGSNRLGIPASEEYLAYCESIRSQIREINAGHC